ncbi:MAG: ABC transporter ATP-binding protein/permease [candidate division Zixibacteria bacterium]|nr:ABC transporter ATP-binding protein/permease [candidate division Zixibacteria bacterium]
MPEAQIDPKPPRFAVLAKYLKGYKGYLIFGGVAVLFANGLLLINPYLLKLIFDALEQGKPQSQVLYYVLLMLGLSIVAGLFRFFMRRTIIWMSRKLEYDLRSELFEHLLTLSPSFYDRNRTGDIMARMTNDLEAVRMMIGPGIMQISNSIVTIAVALSFMIILSPKLTLYSLLPALVLPFLVNKLGNLVHKKYSKIQEHFSVLTAAAQENLAGIRVVKAYRQEPQEIEHFGQISQTYVKLNMDMAKLYGVMFPLLIFVASMLNLVVLYFGGMDVIQGDIPLGTIVAFFSYLTILFWPIMAGGWVVSLYQRGTASLDRINSVLFTPSIVKNDRAKMHIAEMKGEIEFRNLIFAYDGQPILNGISLRIPAGKTVGVVGPVGSGKTTLVSLLPRLYPVTRGMLFVDDVDINDWDLGSLRGQIGFATQEPFLFSDSLRDNLRFGEADASEERVRAVANVAALSKDIEQFPNAFDTVVGERGITLSGGQKQRTAIGRALLPDPAIVVLDDATSAVDTETEDQINERMHAALKHRTTFIISHRVSSVKEADLIIYLEDGKIVEQGDHHQLIALDGNYAELYRSQLLAEEIEKL